MIMAFIRYALFWLPNLFFVITAYLLSPFLATISMVTGPVLPGFLRNWSTTDATLDGGQTQHPDIYPPGAKGFGLWLQRMRWICRNPAQGWQSNVFGFDTAGMTIVSQSVNPNGYWMVMKAANGTTYFSFRIDSPKIWIGWNPKAYDGKRNNYEFQFFT